MARHTYILFLLVFTLVLATVITAFRLRDLSTKDFTTRKNPLLEKCVGDCDSDDHKNTHHSSVSALKVKEISKRRTYEDVKKAVKQKQQSLNERNHLDRVLDAESDDEDKDDEGKLSQSVVSKNVVKNEASNHLNKVPSDIVSKEQSFQTNKIIHKGSERSEGKNDDNENDSTDDNKIQSDSEDSDDDDSDDDDNDSEDDVNTSDNKYTRINEHTYNKEFLSSNKKEEQNKITKEIKHKENYLKEVKNHDPKSIVNSKDQTKLSLLQRKSNKKDDSDDEDEDEKDEDENSDGKRALRVNVKDKISKPESKSEKIITTTASITSSKFETKKGVSPNIELKSEHLTLSNLRNKDLKEQQQSKKNKEISFDNLKESKKLHLDKNHNDEVKKNHIEAESNLRNYNKEEKQTTDKEDKSHTSKKQETKDATQRKQNKLIGDNGEASKKTLQEPKQSNLKEKQTLSRASSALYKKNNFLKNEFEDFYAFLPSFAPNFSRIHNPECRRHGQILMRQLRGTKLWAINMIDASGKVSSGILQGNGNQLGNFDQCLESRARVRLESGHVVKIHGKYCLAQIDVRSDDPELQLPIHLAQARNLLKSKIDDPGHFIPRFSTLKWGVCMPASCGPEDAQFVMKDSLRHYHLAGLNLKINVEPSSCHTEEEDGLDKWLDPATLATLSLFSSIVLLIVYATVRDFLERRSSVEVEKQAEDETGEELQTEIEGEKEEQNENKSCKDSDGIVASFSLYNSCSKLTRDGDAEDIACIHGIRALCSLCLLLAHKIMPVANTPFTNRAQLTELSHTALSVPLRLGWFYTDAFLVLSGVLTAHRLSADHDNSENGMWFRRYVARYIRLTPALLATVLFYAYVWDLLTVGPLWGTLVTENARLCQESWWWNLLYVQNFLPFDEMCAPQTYQLALDMQLTMIAAALVWALRSKPLQALGGLAAIQMLTAYNRYTTTVDHRLSLLIYHGASVSQLYRTARLSYTSALHRSTPYLTGVALGVLLQQRPRHQLSWMVWLPCWLLFAACCVVCGYPALEAASPHARYSALAAAGYAAVAPLAAAAALSWLIYAAHSGNGEWINRLLRARVLVFISRLSYAMYLCQFIIFFTNTATVKNSEEFTIFSILDIRELLTILVTSAAITLTVVIPMQSLSKYVMVYQFSSKEESLEEDPKDQKTEIGNFETLEVIEEIPANRYDNYNGGHIMAHREFLEDTQEAEVEYESQRDMLAEGLEEILEEEEDELSGNELIEDEMMLEEEVPVEESECEENGVREEEIEIVDRAETEGGEDDFWGHQEEDEIYVPRRLSREDDETQQDQWEMRGGLSERSSRYR